jgi:hypothetical protein
MRSNVRTTSSPPVAEARIDGRRKPAKNVDDRENTDLAACGELIVDKNHRPSLVNLVRNSPVLPQLRLNPALWDLITKLQTQFLVKAINPLRIDGPAIPAQQNMHTPVAVAHPRLTDLLNPVLEGGLAAAFGLVDKYSARSMRRVAQARLTDPEVAEP